MIDGLLNAGMPLKACLVLLLQLMSLRHGTQIACLRQCVLIAQLTEPELIGWRVKSAGKTIYPQVREVLPDVSNYHLRMGDIRAIPHNSMTQDILELVFQPHRPV